MCLAGISVVLLSFIKCAIFNLLKLKFNSNDLTSDSLLIVWCDSFLGSLRAVSMYIGQWHACNEPTDRLTVYNEPIGA